MIAEKLLTKLDKIKSGRYTTSDFIIADAKDGDMAFGIAAPGPELSDISVKESTGVGQLKYRDRAHYLDAMQAMAHSELIDILLMSASSAETLQNAQLFTKTNVTPAT